MTHQKDPDCVLFRDHPGQGHESSPDIDKKGGFEGGEEMAALRCAPQQEGAEDQAIRKGERCLGKWGGGPGRKKKGGPKSFNVIGIGKKLDNASEETDPNHRVGEGKKNLKVGGEKMKGKKKNEALITKMFETISGGVSSKSH